MMYQEIENVIFYLEKLIENAREHAERSTDLPSEYWQQIVVGLKNAAAELQQVSDLLDASGPHVRNLLLQHRTANSAEEISKNAFGLTGQQLDEILRKRLQNSHPTKED
jgi:hypothetical protein